jgi:predicted ester cyclase
MTGDELRALATDIWERFNAHDVSDYDERIAADFFNHNAAPGTPRGPEGQRQVVGRLFEAFPDLRFDIEATFIADGRIAVLGWMSGTQTGQFGPFSPSGKSYRARHVHTFRVDERGKLTEHLAVRDDVSMLQQLGHMPDPG